MRMLATVVVTAVVGAGCAAEGDGLVIVFDAADTAAMGRDVVALELFVGVTGPDERHVRDFDPMRDLFAVEMAELPGYRLFLRADVVPDALEAVAIVGYDGDPADASAIAQPLVFGVVEDPPFRAGELNEITMTFVPVTDRGRAGAGERWIERWGAAPIEPVADHACLAWGTGQVAAIDGAIVRADDLDCDGTVPPTCDPMQRDRTLLEGGDDVDGDGYGPWATTACAACLVQDAQDTPLYPVACDCDEADPSVHFGAIEICDGLDTDCDPRTHGDFTGPLAIPCQVVNAPAGDCSMGVHACTESGGLVDDQCRALPASHVSCVDLAACAAPRQCPIGGAGTPSALDVYHCTQREFADAGEYCGVAPISQFFPSLPVPQPTTCSATLWGGNPPGWKVVLVDASGEHDLTFVDRPCDTLAILVEQAPAVNASHAVVVLTIGDGAGDPIAVIPIDLGLSITDGVCTVADRTLCTPPVGGT